MAQLKQTMHQLAQKWLPRSTRRKLARWGQWPPIGFVRFGSLRRLRPISDDWGGRRGLPIDRYYIEKFLAQHSQDIHGRVLEVKDNTYTKRFGGDKVTHSDVLHKLAGNPHATIVADLAAVPSQLPPATYDTIICTQTLHLIYEVEVAIATLYHSLKLGGVLLVTVPTISQICRVDMDQSGDYWRFTTAAAQRLFQENAPAAEIQVGVYGNVLTAVASLYGLASNELSRHELDFFDPDYEFLITVHVKKVKEISEN